MFNVASLGWKQMVIIIILIIIMVAVVSEKLGGGVRHASQNPYPVYNQNL